jgi:DNA-binding transcriptional MerR regulator
MVGMSQPDPLMSIGMFSTATLVSIKALRLYHAQGLLLPASIDPVTGYRFYRVSQLADAEVIKRLRDLDVPLAAVGEVVRARDPEVTRRVIAEHERAMRERLHDLSRVVSELQKLVSEPTVPTPVFVRTEPARPALAILETVPNPEHDTYAEFLDRAFLCLYASIIRLNLVPAAASGALYPPKMEGDEEVVTAFVPVNELKELDEQSIADGVTYTTLPSVTCAVLTHRGSYRTMANTYRQLGAWVATNATAVELPVRELYVVSVDEAGDLFPDTELRTEIAWPIANPISLSNQTLKEPE